MSETLQDIQNTVGAWHVATFPGVDAVAPLYKLEEELTELFDAEGRESDEAEEAADCAIALLAYCNLKRIDLPRQRRIRCDRATIHSKRCSISEVPPSRASSGSKTAPTLAEPSENGMIQYQTPSSIGRRMSPACLPAGRGTLS